MIINRRFRRPGGPELPSRRALLRGAGVCLALPWLEALIPKKAVGQTLPPPLRFLPVFFPNGAAADYWTLGASGSGDAWKLSPVLEPFAPLKQKMVALTNLENYSSMTDNLDIEPSHARCTGAFLTCVDSDLIRRERGLDIGNGVSVDQALAQKLPRQTTFASLQVGLSTMESFCDGRDCSLSQSVSWAGTSEPLYKEVNPQALFDMLVGGLSVQGDDQEAVHLAEQRRALSQSVLDAVLENASHTRTRLGVADQRRLEQFLNSVRELELQVNNVGSSMAQNCEVASAPGRPAQYGLSNGQDGYDRATHSAAMNDLILMAFRCDSTRIISYMLDDARSDFAYDHLQNREFTAEGSRPGNGQVAGFHGLQHAGDSNNGYATINHWFSTQISELCQRMDEIEEGDGSLLDHTVVLYGSGMHGSNHDPSELPIALIGGGGGRIKGDQHIVFGNYPDDRPLRDLYYTLLNEVYAADVPSFGTHFGGRDHALMSEILV